jgi:hypothetical protein
MKTTKHSSPEASTPPATADVATQLGSLQKALSPIVSLTVKQRGQLENRSANVPDALIEQMIEAANKNGGVVAGFAFDTAAASATLTEVKAARAAAASAGQIAQQLTDSATSQRVILANRVFGIYRAMERLVGTPEGNSLLRTYQAMASTVKNRPRKPRKKKTTAGITSSGKKAAASPEQTSTPAPAESPAEAPVSAPAPAAPAAAAAVGASHP